MNDNVPPGMLLVGDFAAAPESWSWEPLAVPEFPGRVEIIKLAEG